MVAFVVDSTSACAASRRELGATAWFVLEELVIRSALEDDRSLRVQVSTRDLAVSLGLNKDTVTRILARLRARGVVALVARGGASGASVFSIVVPAGLVIIQRVPEVDAGARRGKRRRTSEQDQNVAQLSLLTWDGFDRTWPHYPDDGGAGWSVRNILTLSRVPLFRIDLHNTLRSRHRARMSFSLTSRASLAPAPSCARCALRLISTTDGCTACCVRVVLR